MKSPSLCFSFLPEVNKLFKFSLEASNFLRLVRSCSSARTFAVMDAVRGFLMELEEGGFAVTVLVGCGPVVDEGLTGSVDDGFGATRSVLVASAFFFRFFPDPTIFLRE